jgi:hypothetical protein
MRGRRPVVYARPGTAHKIGAIFSRAEAGRLRARSVRGRGDWLRPGSPQGLWLINL